MQILIKRLLHVVGDIYPRRSRMGCEVGGLRLHVTGIKTKRAAAGQRMRYGQTGSDVSDKHTPVGRHGLAEIKPGKQHDACHGQDNPPPPGKRRIKTDVCRNSSRKDARARTAEHQNNPHEHGHPPSDTRSTAALQHIWEEQGKKHPQPSGIVEHALHRKGFTRPGEQPALLEQPQTRHQHGPSGQGGAKPPPEQRLRRDRHACYEHQNECTNFTHDFRPEIPKIQVTQKQDQANCTTSQGYGRLLDRPAAHAPEQAESNG